MSDFLQLQNKTVLVTGVANRKSVAFHIARLLQQAGAHVIYSVRSEERRAQVAKLTGDDDIFVCDVGDSDQISNLATAIQQKVPVLHGVVHSIAFADYTDGLRPFHETNRSDFLNAVDVSCYSLIALSNALKDLLAIDASVVTISISTTRMASENYGLMGPVKAALDSSLAFLSKSFSRFSRVRFNAVGPGLLKTSASAGIPGYVDSYLYAEQAIPRGEAVGTEEAAAAAVFLLSPRSSGIVAQTIVVDAGMSINYFDPKIVSRVVDAPKSDPQ